MPNTRVNKNFITRVAEKSRPEIDEAKQIQTIGYLLCGLQNQEVNKLWQLDWSRHSFFFSFISGGVEQRKSINNGVTSQAQHQVRDMLVHLKLASEEKTTVSSILD